MKIPLTMKPVADLADAVGAAPVNRLPGCWEIAIDDHWWLACNGHREPQVPEGPPGGMGLDSLAPFTVAVWFNGWLAGLMDGGGGTLVAGGLADEDALVAALEARLNKERSQEAPCVKEATSKS